MVEQLVGEAADTVAGLHSWQGHPSWKVSQNSGAFSRTGGVRECRSLQPTHRTKDRKQNTTDHSMALPLILANQRGGDEEHQNPHSPAALKIQDHYCTRWEGS